MKLLQLFSQAFEEVPKPYERVKDFLQRKREELGDKKFVSRMIYWTGCRSFNRFEEHGLLALNLANFFNFTFSCFNTLDFSEVVIKELVGEYLFDDRHDIYQNIPYTLEEILKASTEEEKEEILAFFAKIYIDCFNPNGTAETSSLWKYPEED